MFISSFVGRIACRASVADVKEGRLNGAAKAHLIGMIGDLLICITTLVIGILSLYSVIKGIPPIGTHVLFGIGGTIGFTWILLAALTPKGLPKFCIKLVKDAIKVTFRSDSQKNTYSGLKLKIS